MRYLGPLIEVSSGGLILGPLTWGFILDLFDVATLPGSLRLRLPDGAFIGGPKFRALAMEALIWALHVRTLHGIPNLGFPAGALRLELFL